MGGRVWLLVGEGGEDSAMEEVEVASLRVRQWLWLAAAV